VPDDSIDQLIRDAESAIASAAAAAGASQAAQQPAQPTTPPADANAAQRDPDGQGETLEALEARLRAAHDERVRNASFEAQRPANEAMLKNILGSAYRALADANADSASDAEYPQPGRRDGTPLTPLDMHLANELARLLPHMDLDGSRQPRSSRR
jgi:hypothetical protein